MDMLAPLRLHKLQDLQTNPIEQQRRDVPPVQTAFDRANAQLDKGQLTAAVDTCLKIIRNHPINAVTATNIVLLMRQAARPDLGAAIETALIQQLTDTIPPPVQTALFRSNLGWILFALARLDDAYAMMAGALALDPLDQRSLATLTTHRLKQGDPDGAVALWHPAFAASPTDGLLRLNLVRRLATQKFMDHAKQILDLAEPLCVNHRDQFSYIADSVRGTETAHAQAAMTVDLFDAFAESYDDNLKKLHNRGPEIIGRLLTELNLPRKRKLTVLDAGCGTGLCAPYLRPYARQLHGVDLSEGMLQKCKAKGTYNELGRSDLANIGTMPVGPYDLIASSDVLVYFGNLATVLANFAALLQAGGWLLITVEDVGNGASAPGWTLTPTGRHKHSETYVRAALTAAGFANPTVRLQDDLRRESGVPVACLCFATQRLALFAKATAPQLAFNPQPR